MTENLADFSSIAFCDKEGEITVLEDAMFRKSFFKNIQDYTNTIHCIPDPENIDKPLVLMSLETYNNIADKEMVKKSKDYWEWRIKEFTRDTQGLTHMHACSHFNMEKERKLHVAIG